MHPSHDWIEVSKKRFVTELRICCQCKCASTHPEAEEPCPKQIYPARGTHKPRRPELSDEDLEKINRLRVARRAAGPLRQPPSS